MVLKLHALAYAIHKLGIPLLPSLLTAINRIAFATSVPASTKIGRGVTLSYQGLGTVMHARAVIGNNVYIGPNVTIGGRSGLYDVPVIEDDCYIGTGARILGPVRVGRGAVVGANAVVIHDVPSGTVVVGIPAKVVKPSSEVGRLALQQRDCTTNVI